jgi:monofunctional chorismate mutase
MDEIRDLRRQIDEIDDKIMELLDIRYNITKKVGDVKKKQNVTILDSNREKNILEKTSKYSHSPQIRLVYEAIMNISKTQQRK